jgi:hypothetical protein
MDRRKITLGNSSDLPLPYLKMVEESCEHIFLENLLILRKNKNVQLKAYGKIYPDEICLAVNLIPENRLSGLCFYASIDFEPTQKTEPLLDACVNALSSVMARLFEVDQENIFDISLSDLSEAFSLPVEWTHVSPVYVKLDRSNLLLEVMTEAWLAQHDPQYEKTIDDTQKEIEKLFVGKHSVNGSQEV